VDDDGEISIRLVLANLKVARTELQALLTECNSHWGFEDPVYRFYHHSFKVFALQATTMRIVELLQSLAPGRPLDPWFVQITSEGTGKTFSVDQNAAWPRHTRPIVEAFFHARYFLEMASRYGELDGPPNPMPSGWAALLCLYGLR